MVKSFFEGIVAAIGFAVGIIVLMMILLTNGQKILRDTVDESFRKSFEEPAVAVQIDRAEKFQDCVLNNWGNDANVSEAELVSDAKFAIQSCMSELRAWKQSPSFNGDWQNLLNRDQTIRYIVTIYNTK